MSFLVDTDICSAHLKNVGRVTNRFLQYTGRLNVSVVSLAELYSWALRPKTPPKHLAGLMALLDDVTVLVIDREIARRCGDLQAQLLDQGQPLPIADLLIAATALVHGLTMVTHNTAHFAPVPGLTVTDWLLH